MVTATQWVTVATAIKLIGFYAILLLIASTVSATEFGLFSTALIAVNFAQMVAEGGLPEALIFRREFDRVEF